MSMKFKFEIVGPAPEEEVNENEEEASQILHAKLSLIEGENGGADVVLLNEDGVIGIYVLSINADGTYSRYVGGNPAGKFIDDWCTDCYIQESECKEKVL